MQVEIVAIGTELLLGQIVDTNSAFIGQSLAEAGVECFFQTRVGDNLGRIKLALDQALSRSDAVIVCGGLGPTQDDITREAIALVMGVELELDDSIAEGIKLKFSSRGRVMAENNLRQALVPKGATPILQSGGTAPGLVCPIGNKVIYAAPGVPYELSEMLSATIIPDLLARGGIKSEIMSRVIRTWGLAESSLAEILDPIFQQIDNGDEKITLAFLASGIEGIKVRLTARGATNEESRSLLDKYHTKVEELVGDHVFGVDEVTMEAAVGSQLMDLGLFLGVAESVTGGLVASRIVGVPGASRWFRGGLVSYASEVKFALLGVEVGEVVSREAVLAMASGVRELLGADVGLSFSGVAGPDAMEDKPPGTVWVGIDAGALGTHAQLLRLPGDRERIRQFATISGMDILRRFLARSHLHVST